MMREASARITCAVRHRASCAREGKQILGQVDGYISFFVAAVGRSMSIAALGVHGTRGMLKKRRLPHDILSAGGASGERLHQLGGPQITCASSSYPSYSVSSSSAEEVAAPLSPNTPEHLPVPDGNPTYPISSAI